MYSNTNSSLIIQISSTIHEFDLIAYYSLVDSQLPMAIYNYYYYTYFLVIGRISNSDTNLLYRSSIGKRQTIQNNTFMPVFFDELNFTAEQRMICEDNPQCLFDLVVTGELEIAMNTLQFEKEANATKEILGKLNV